MSRSRPGQIEGTGGLEIPDQTRAHYLMTIELHHVAVPVNNLESAARFYAGYPLNRAGIQAPCLLPFSPTPLPPGERGFRSRNFEASIAPSLRGALNFQSGYKSCRCRIKGTLNVGFFTVPATPKTTKLKHHQWSGSTSDGRNRGATPKCIIWPPFEKIIKRHLLNYSCTYLEAMLASPLWGWG